MGYWIFSTAHQLQQTMNEELAEHGITLRQWEVLVWLSLTGSCTQSELAAQMRIEAPTLVGVLDRMQRDGWIKRVPDAEDRRRKRIYPTQQVEPVWAKMVECALRVRQRALAGIDDEQLRSVRQALEQMRQNLAGDVRPTSPARQRENA